MKPSTDRNLRILVIDDNRAIHQDFQKILCPSNQSVEDLDDLEHSLFGKSSQTYSEMLPFELDFASQGMQGFEMVKRAKLEGRPYAMAFVDMRMPPGWDGLETIVHLWRVAPDLQVVICTAFSDHSWSDITRRLGHSANLLILKKPFDHVEIIQLATALCEKWQLTREARMTCDELERKVRDQTRDIKSAYDLSLHILRHVQWDWTRQDQNRALQLIDDQDRRMVTVEQYREAHQIKDQRADRRVPYRTPVTMFLRSDNPSQTSGVVKCWSHNLSASGMSLILNRMIREVDVIVFLDSSTADPIICEAEIVRTKQLDVDLWEYGIRFKGRAFKSMTDQEESPKAELVTVG